MSLPWILFVALVGLCVGSFLNVVALRVPARRSPVRGRSACPSCHAVIAWYDDIPVVSWVVLRARCRRCAAPIGARYVVMELATGAAYGAAAAVAPGGLVLGVLLAAVSLLVVLIAMVAFAPGGGVERPPR